MQEIVALIAAAQEADGYPYETAVAHYRATGKRTLLEVAVRHANPVASVFGADRRRDQCGRSNVEQAPVYARLPAEVQALLFQMADEDGCT